LYTDKDRMVGRGSTLRRDKVFLFSAVFRLALVLPSLLPSGYWGFFHKGDLGVKLGTHLHLMLRSKMVAIHLFHDASSWHGA
jgi:hypothetical protein